MNKKGKPAGGAQKILTGVLDVTRSGRGFLIQPNGDIPVPRENLGGALSGDVVSIKIFPRRGRMEGHVTQVLERKKNSFVGTVVRRGEDSFLKPDDPRVYHSFRIVGGVGTPQGQKVLVDVVRWDAAPPEASVRRALGVAGAHDTEMRAILAGHEFDTEFPKDVTSEAEALTMDASGDRRDFRGVLTVTIDPRDAKDHDDAISYRELENGDREIGVHIADVAHFVRPGTALDREALERGTSVYLVDRTVPMLPPRLSEELCSLLPGVDRFAFSAVFVVRGSSIVDRWFGKTIIHVGHRLAYEDADIALLDPAHELHTPLTTLNSYAKELRARRVERGALVFDRDELKPILNERKEAIRFDRVRATPARQLIEELMLLANREVAGLVRKAIGTNRVFLYRIHDVPNAEKLEELAVFLRAIGHQLTLGGKGDSAELNRMLAAIKGTPEENMIKVATIRSMAKAVYSTKNIGHFGLSFKDYTHFTSPIRRYPDVLVHRTLERVLQGAPFSSNENMEDIAIHTSGREAEAAEAERASVRLKQLEYMEQHMGEERTGIISGVTEWGVYVEDTESGAEGMARLDTLPGRYEFHQKKFAVIDAISKHAYRLGDSVQFSALRVSVEERVIDVTLVPQGA